MKKLLAVTGAILISYVILTSAVANEAAAPSAGEADNVAVEADDGYTVADHEGRVAVYRAGRLYRLTDTPTASLPKSDRLKLERGIRVDSDKELKSILEDYCS